MSEWPQSVDELSAIEKASLRAFVESCAHLFTGRVLDYGCGRQPYRDVVEKAGGEYLPYNRATFPGCAGGGNVGVNNPLALGADTILCTQVIQYVAEADYFLRELRGGFRGDGVLIITGPTSWIEPPGHLHNLTLAGARLALEDAGFTVERLESRGHIGPGLSIGWAAVGRA